jgi:hypothetical protein
MGCCLDEGCPEAELPLDLEPREPQGLLAQQVLE